MRIIIILILVILLGGCSLSDKLKQLDDNIGDLLNKMGNKDVVDDKDKDTEEKDKELDGNLSSSEKSKIEKWLEENNLNKYGDSEGTYYTGGTPLFDESTGERVDRYDYIFKKIPDILEKIK